LKRQQQTTPKSITSKNMPDQNAAIVKESNAHSEDLFLEDDLNDIFDGQGDDDEDMVNDDNDFRDDAIGGDDSSDSGFGETTDEIKNESDLQFCNQKSKGNSVSQDRSNLLLQSESGCKVQDEIFPSEQRTSICSSGGFNDNVDRKSLSGSTDIDNLMLDANDLSGIGTVPPPSWQCEDADREHRRAMILEM
jgi:hypothetical protein